MFIKLEYEYQIEYLTSKQGMEVAPLEVFKKEWIDHCVWLCAFVWPGKSTDMINEQWKKKDMIYEEVNTWLCLTLCFHMTWWMVLMMVTNKMI